MKPQIIILFLSMLFACKAAGQAGKTEGSGAVDKTSGNDSLWAFQPVRMPEAPQVKNREWPRDTIDRFVIAGMERQGLQPGADAQPSALIRRLHYDLIGLPPTMEAVEAFRQEAGVDFRAAVERLVDDLLASPHFGERWGRHWLDVARFGESNGDDGLGRNASFPHAWRYRDYVINALNRDVPYDRFITEQIAGDLLPHEDDAQRDRQLVATGFLAIGAKPAKAMNNNFAMDVVDDQINVVSTAVMGLSVACARCHDHEHDPVPTRDYYALAGIFTSTETLWGRAGNEKLTAPATPLHELKTMVRRDGQPDPSLKITAGVPVFSSGYQASIAGLKPELYIDFKKLPDSLAAKKDVSVSVENAGVFHGGWLEGHLKENIDSYTVSFWFRNDIENQARAVTGYLFSRGPGGAKGAPGDHIGIGGNYENSPHHGKLFFFNGNDGGVSLKGKHVIPPRTWNHVVLVRDGKRVTLYLNGNTEPEIDHDAAVTTQGAKDIFIGGRNDHFALTLNGNMAQFALFPRALSADEAQELHGTSGRPRGSGKILPPQRAPKATPGNLAMGVRERKKPADIKIHRNGESKQLGEVVARGFLSAIQMNEAVKVDPAQSGRLQLARWLTHPQHPLTARVMVNRIWHHLFGQPIVATPDDFGVYGTRPTHPALLDHLARRFIAEQWSIKRMIRNIVLSRTYQLDSAPGSAQAAIDPENTWLSRHSRRRLDAESLRDSILQASGQLEAKPRIGSDISQLDILINWPPGEAPSLHRSSLHRSIYLCFLRHAPPPELSAFDLPDGVKVMGRRHVTTQPAHGLYLLNNPMVVEQAGLLGKKLIIEAGETEPDRVRWAYRRILQRNPSEKELGRSITFVRSLRDTLNADNTKTDAPIPAWATLCQALLASNEFRYID